MAGSDYERFSFNLTFYSGSMDDDTRCVNVSIIDDGAFEDDETFTVTLTTSDPDVILGNMTTVTIIKNDGTITIMLFCCHIEVILSLYRCDSVYPSHTED